MRGTEGNIFIAKTAVEYVRSAISTAFPMGSGHGPLNHSHLTTKRALPQPTKSNPHPFVSHLIQSDLPLWKSYVRSSPSDIHEEKLMRGPTPICGTAWKGYTTSGMFRTLYKAGLSLPTALYVLLPLILKFLHSSIIIRSRDDVRKKGKADSRCPSTLPWSVQIVYF